MFDALYIGATGMQAQQLNVDTIANNLANVNTTGFKKTKLSFSDLMVKAAMNATANASELDAGLTMPAVRLGAGVAVSSRAKIFDMGDLKKTDSSYDIAIQGEGFIEVVMPDGSKAYTRGGTLKVNSDGQLSTQAGHALKPGINVPENAQSLMIQSDGRVQIRSSDSSTVIDIGQIELVKFNSPGGMLAEGENIYRATIASGDGFSSKAGEDGLGTLAQGYLEGSNVKMVDEMVNLMVAQRIYEANVKVVQASDEMLGMINGLRR